MAGLPLDQAQTNPLASDSPAAIIARSNTTTKNTNVSVGRVNVDARGGDSEQISAGVSGALKEQLQQTMSNFDDGVVA